MYKQLTVRKYGNTSGITSGSSVCHTHLYCTVCSYVHVHMIQDMNNPASHFPDSPTCTRTAVHVHVQLTYTRGNSVATVRVRVQ